ncbi:MAG: putative 4-hydroxybenzoate polyprenyltransferase [Saprospiraceae bacterium]|nr:putative 4-hydroxybenzoate polyprenyltransferase [Saprospiraceae bacterium]
MKKYLSLVTFSHTIFALPFALIGFFLAFVIEDTTFSIVKLGLILLCMVFARSAAMAFNRYLDRDIDLKNPRTATREIPSGMITPKNALIFTFANCMLFIICTYFINWICFLLSPIALLVVLGYSYTKRFTYLCHFVLGTGLALAPVGAYLAVTGHFHILPILYGFLVLTWVSGFDIMYALQDEEFDKKESLYSIPVKLGAKDAMNLSIFLHIISALLIIYISFDLNKYIINPFFHWVGALIFIGLLIYQHTLVKPNDLSKINRAFFTTNGLASLLYATFVITDIIY